MAKELLNDAQCLSFRPRKKPYRRNDGGGLYLLIRPSGHRYWQYRYYLDGKEKLLQIGPYPDISLKEARKRHSEHVAVAQSGRDPVIARKQSKLQQARSNSESFAAIAQEWLEHFKPDWSSVHYERNEGLLRRVLLPKLGPLPLRDVDVTTLLTVLRAYEARGRLMSARRARTIASQIFAYAISSGRAAANPARDLLGAMKPRPQTKHHAAISLEQVGPMLKSLDASTLQPRTKAAVRLMLYTGLRDFALRAARWQEIDLGAQSWTVPPERCKGRVGKRVAHTVPLPKQAVKALKELQPLTDRGPESFVFPGGGKHGCLSENSITKALGFLGFEGATAHGFRSLITDQLYLAQFHDKAIERQLSHADRSEVRSAYLRDDFLDHRRVMMQWWADVCDALVKGKPAPKVANVISLRPGVAA